MTDDGSNIRLIKKSEAGGDKSTINAQTIDEGSNIRLIKQSGAVGDKSSINALTVDEVNSNVIS